MAVPVLVISLSVLVVAVEDAITWAVLAPDWTTVFVFRKSFEGLTIAVVSVTVEVVAAITDDFEEVAEANAGVVTRLVVAVRVEVAITLVGNAAVFIVVIVEVLKDDIVGRERFLLFGGAAIIRETDVTVTIDVLVNAKANVVVGFNISELIGRVTVVK